MPDRTEWIVIAEPDPSRAGTFDAIFRRAGFPVTVVDDVAGALSAVARDPSPALLVLNLSLRCGSAIDVLTAVADRTTSTSVLAITDDERLRRLAIDVGLSKLLIVRPQIHESDIEATAARLLFRRELRARDAATSGTGPSSDADTGGSGRESPPIRPPAPLGRSLSRPEGEVALANEHARVVRSRAPCSLLLVALDGPMPADAAARSGGESSQQDFATIDTAVARYRRTTDVVVRWAPREWLVILPGVAIHAARAFGERLRAAIGDGRAPTRLTLSGGAAELVRDEDPSEAVQRAARALSAARRDGCNRIR